MLRISLAVIVLAALLSGHGTSAQQSSSPQPSETLQTMQKARLFSASESLLRSGFNGELNTRNWRKLAMKLSTPGAKIQIVTFGGSITAGHLEMGRNGSWVEQMEVWMKQAFPSVKIEVLNLARGATDVTAASTCWYNFVPPNADLVFIEYSANGCTRIQCTSIISPLVADYESLLRRLIRRAPNAALMSFATFAYYTHQANGKDGSPVSVPTPFYNSGQDMHELLTRRYGVPMVSARDALYNIMWDDVALKSSTGYKRNQLMKDDIHPAFLGHDLYGRGLIAWAMRFILTRELTDIASSRRSSGAIEIASAPYGSSSDVASTIVQAASADSAVAAAATKPGSQLASLPPPISPIAAREADGDTFCAEGAWLARYVVKSSATMNGWVWTDDASPLSLKYCDHFNCHKYGYKANGATKSLDIQISTKNYTTASKLENRALVVFFTRSPNKNDMGTAKVQCINGCSCIPIELDGYNADFYSTLGAGSTPVSASDKCTIRITIMDKTSSGGRAFKVDGVAVVPYTDLSPLTPIDKLALQPIVAGAMEAETV